LPHLLLAGRDGYGKRWIAGAFAQIYQSHPTEVEADSIERVVDLETILNGLGYREWLLLVDLETILNGLRYREWLLLVDIHKTTQKIVRQLRVVLEKFEIEVVRRIGRRLALKEKRSLTPFTCIATTTSEADCNPAELRAFGQNKFRLKKYTEIELQRIGMKLAGARKMRLQPIAAGNIAKASDGSVRWVGNVVDKLVLLGKSSIGDEDANVVLSMFGSLQHGSNGPKTATGLLALSPTDFAHAGELEEKVSEGCSFKHRSHLRCAHSHHDHARWSSGDAGSSPRRSSCLFQTTAKFQAVRRPGG